MNKAKCDFVPGTDFVIYQNEENFKYGIDSLILSSFCPGKGKFLDLGCGTGILSLRLAMRTEFIQAVDINPNVVELMKRSICENGLEEKIEVKCCDILNLPEQFNGDSFDGIIMNPPYFNQLNKDNNRLLARQERNISSFLGVCHYLLRSNKPLYMLFPTDRLSEICYLLESYKLRVKNIVVVQHRRNKMSHFSIIRAVKSGQFGNHFRHFYVMEEDDFSDEMKKVYANEVIR